jgi:RNA polymerase sigma-70 factor (ECF subfamily)
VTNSEFKSAFEEHKDAVYRFAWRMTASAETAEDVTHDAFLALLRRPEAFDPNRGRLRSFLFAIARNLVLKRWRDERPWEVLDDEQFVAEPPDVRSGETADIVAAAVRKLPPLQREALILAEYEELSLAEIAQSTDCEIGTVKSRLHRAKENLRRMLAPLKAHDATGKPRLSHGTAK